MDDDSLASISCLGSIRDGAGSSVLVQQDCSVRDTSLQHSDEANAFGETHKRLGETAAVYGTSFLVAEDILKGRACLGVERESGEHEVKNMMENLNEIIDEQSVMKAVSVGDPPGKDFQLGDRDELNVIHNADQDSCSVKEIQGKSRTFYKDCKTFYDAYGLQNSIEKLESDNLEMLPNMKEAISSSSQLSGVTDDVILAAVGKDGPRQMLQPPLEGASINSFGRKLLVLDVNGILVDVVSHGYEGCDPDKIISGKAVFKRPFCDDFLQFCFERFHVGVWSSRTKKNLDSVLEFLMGKRKCDLLFCWDQSHCTNTGFNTLHNKDKPLVLKELTKLWEKQEPDLPWNRGDYNKSNTLLLDDSPYKALRNPAYTAIFPYPYQYKDAEDNTLGPGGDLRVYLEGLASASNVQKYVEMNPFGQRPITETNLYWNFYRNVMNASSSQAEEDANNSLADQQRLAPNDRHMGFGGQLPLHAPHDQGVGFDSRDAVVAMPKTRPVTMRLPQDASSTIYVEGLPPDSTRREVAHIFRPFAGYRNVRLVRKESRRRGGYYPFILGFVEFEDPACAAAALTALDGYMVDETDRYSAYLRLEFSRGKRPSARSKPQKSVIYNAAYKFFGGFSLRKREKAEELQGELHMSHMTLARLRLQHIDGAESKVTGNADIMTARTKQFLEWFFVSKGVTSLVLMGFMDHADENDSLQRPIFLLESWVNDGFQSSVPLREWFQDNASEEWEKKSYCDATMKPGSRMHIGPLLIWNFPYSVPWRRISSCSNSLLYETSHTQGSTA